MRLMVLAAALAALPACDDRCSLENCRTLLEQCNLVPAGSPNSDVCFNKTPYDPSYDTNKTCVRACNGTKSGKVVQCVADLAKKNQCGDLDAVNAACLPDAKTPDATCRQSCFAERRACEDACPVTSFGACTECATDCAITDASCSEKC
jgi:hypothetical protein